MSTAFILSCQENAAVFCSAVLLIDEKFHYFKNIQKIQYSLRLSLCFYHFTSSKGTTFLRRVLKTGWSSLESSITFSSLCSRAFRVKSNESGFTRISGRELCCFSLPFTRHTRSSQRKGFRGLLHMQSSASAPCFFLLQPACAVLTHVRKAMCLITLKDYLDSCTVHSAQKYEIAFNDAI